MGLVGHLAGCTVGPDRSAITGRSTNTFTRPLHEGGGAGCKCSDSLGGGTVPSEVAVDMAPIFEILFSACGAATTVAVHTYDSTCAASAAGFFIEIN